MTQSIENQLIHQQNGTASITKIEPKEPPRLIKEWIMDGHDISWCIHTNGLKFDTEQLHDFLKTEIEQQGVPVNVFLSKDAAWIIEGARGRAKVEEDRRPRVVATLQNSPYTDMQFIAGIDYFGSHWAKLQMMLVVQPETIKIPPKPVTPLKPDTTPLLPKEALIVLAVIAGGMLLLGNIALKLLGFIGLAGVTYLFIKSNADIKKAQKKYERELEAYEQELAEWEAEKEEIQLEQQDLEKYRASRSFKSEDLFTFWSVMVSKVILKIEELKKQGATVEAIEDGKSRKTSVDKLDDLM